MKVYISEVYIIEVGNIKLAISLSVDLTNFTVTLGGRPLSLILFS